MVLKYFNLLNIYEGTFLRKYPPYMFDTFTLGSIVYFFEQFSQ